MKSIISRYQTNLRNGGFAMLASGAAALILFVVATTIVGFDTSSKERRFAAAGEAATHTHTQVAPATAAR